MGDVTCLYFTCGSTDAGWVAGLYQNVLERDVDQGGSDYWVRHIQTHSPHSVVLGFVTSDEYRLRAVDLWFSEYLDRDLDASGAQYWLRQLRHGVSQESIQIGLMSSVEFRAA